RAALLYSAQDLRLEDVPTALPAPDEVQIRPRASGICGSDMHYYQNGKNGPYPILSGHPLILGHEACGDVVAVGSDVTSIKVGDRVVVEPQVACRKCNHCKEGTYNLCTKLKFIGSASIFPPIGGSLQQIYNRPADSVYLMPEDMSYIEGAMIEPTSVAIHAIRRSGLRAGQSVIIVGAGAVGLLCASIAKFSGASKIGMIDIDQSRLEFAKKKGMADHIFTMPLKGQEGESKPDFAARIGQEILQHPGFDRANVVFDCTGIDTCVNTCIEVCASGGKVVLVGLGTPVQNINIGGAGVREIDLLGLWRYTNTFDTAIEMVKSGRLDLKQLVTHTYDLEKAADALKL
ncbi:GroES-like protein, partial [Rhizodiscina lignyota]